MDMKHYIWKHSLGLAAIIFQMYEIKEKRHSHISGKRRGSGR